MNIRKEIKMKKTFFIFVILAIAFLSIYAITKRPFSIPATNWTSVTIGPPTTFEDSVITEGKIYPESGTSSSYLNLGASNLHLKESGDAYADIWSATGYIADAVWEWKESAYPGTKHFIIDIPGDSVWTEDLRVGNKIYSESDESSSYLNLGASNLHLKESGDAYADIWSATGYIADAVWEWKESAYPGTKHFIIDIPGDSVWTKNLIVADSIKIGEAGDWIRRIDWDSDSLYFNIKGSWKAIKLTASNGP
jgi:hypothetical protein